MLDPTHLLRAWNTLRALPGGKRVFSGLVGRMAPYTGTIPFRVLDLGPGRCTVRMQDRRQVRNHLRSVHAIALMNLGEVATGLAMYAGLPPGSRGIITELTMRYERKARGTITASCTTEVPQNTGRHDLIVHASLRDPDGTEVATARAVWRIDITA